MTEQSAAQLAQSVSVFIIFEIIGGCECCTAGPRQTVLPAGWAGRAGQMTLAQVLAFAHGVTPGAIKIRHKQFADGMTREDVAAARARYMPAAV